MEVKEKAKQIFEVLQFLQKVKEVVDPAEILPRFVKSGGEEKEIGRVLFGLALADPDEEDAPEAVEIWKLFATQRRVAENVLNGRFRNVILDPEENVNSFLGAVLDADLPLDQKRKILETLGN